MSISEGADANAVLPRFLLWENRPRARHSPRENPPACLPASGGWGCSSLGVTQPWEEALLKEAGGWRGGSFLPGALPDPDRSPTIDPRLQLWGSSSWKGPGPPSLRTSLEGLLLPLSVTMTFQPQGSAPQPPAFLRSSTQRFSLYLYTPWRTLSHPARWCLHLGRPRTQSPCLAVSPGQVYV